MEIKGIFKMKGSIQKGLKFLVTANELNDSIPEGYLINYSRNFYLATPGKKIQKIEIENYNPWDRGHRPGFRAAYGSPVRFAALSSHPKDWDFYVVIEQWDTDSQNNLIEWKNVVLNYVNGRESGNFSEVKNINHGSIFNPYAGLSPIGNGEFIGDGMSWFYGRNEFMNLGVNNAPSCFYSKASGLTQLDHLITQSISFTTETNSNFITQKSWINTEGFGNIYLNDYLDYFEYLNYSTPKKYKISKNVDITESFNLQANIIQTGGIYNLSGSVSFQNYNITGLRNNKKALIIKVIMDDFTVSDLGFIYGQDRNWFPNEVISQIILYDLETGESNVMCEYTSSFIQGRGSLFKSGMAGIFNDGFTDRVIVDSSLAIINSTTDISLDVLPKFLKAIFTTNILDYNGYSVNSVLIDNFVYHVFEVVLPSNDSRNIFKNDYQVKVRKFNIEDLSSCEEFILEVEKSELPDIPISTGFSNSILLSSFQYC